MNEELEKENSQNQDDELESLLNSSVDEEASASSDEETLTPEQVKALKEELRKKDSLNKQLAARLYKMKEAKSKVVENKDDSFWRQKIEFLISHKDFDLEHLDYLEAVAKGKGITLEEAYKLPIVQKAIESSLKEKKTC
jgi:ATP-dependent Lon protease